MVHRIGSESSKNRPLGGADALGEESGFTLIELIISVALFTFGLVAVLSSATTLARMQQVSEYDALSATYLGYLLTDLHENINNSGQIANVTAYTRDQDFGNLFDTPWTGFLPGFDRPVTLSMQRMDVGVVPDPNPTEVQITLSIAGATGNTVFTRSAYRMIRWDTES